MRNEFKEHMFMRAVSSAMSALEKAESERGVSESYDRAYERLDEIVADYSLRDTFNQSMIDNLRAMTRSLNACTQVIREVKEFVEPSHPQ